MLAVIIQAGKRSVDEPLHSGPTGEEGVGPESDRRQMITVDRATDHFRDHVISGAEPDAPNQRKRRLFANHQLTAACITPCTGTMKSMICVAPVDPREPEKRAEQIPLRDVDRDRRDESGTSGPPRKRSSE